MLLNISQERWPGVATPEEPQLSSPGFSFTRAINSGTVFAATLGCATST
jgi:hypothetical protein